MLKLTFITHNNPDFPGGFSGTHYQGRIEAEYNLLKKFLVSLVLAMGTKQMLNGKLNFQTAQ